ncbi:MAG: phosphate ABC transporter permease subunit PstC [Desulfurococcales archaeon]|nr:phosphate ABC transporter permease subunit PstC [Desulfurococcales archaeon]
MAKSDKRFFYSLVPAALVSSLILVLLFIVLIYYSAPAFKEYGFRIFTTKTWSPSEESARTSEYGLFIPLLGTLVSAIIAVVLALPFAISTVIFTEEVIPKGMNKVRETFSTLIDVMTGLPTIVYGLWGLAILAPFLRDNLYNPLYAVLGSIPLFSCRPVTGTTILTAGILLSMMIMPFMYSVIRHSYKRIPAIYKEAALALGTTKYEYSKIMMGMVKPSILAGILIGFGRAAGETVAVALVVGNTFNMPSCLLSSSYTISALIANQFGNAALYPYMINVLVVGGLILLLIGIVSNILGIMYLNRVRYTA